MKAKIVLFVLVGLLFVTACNEKDKSYKKELATADSLFKAEKYEEAKTYITSILKKHPKDEVALKKLKDINSFLAQQKKDSDFQDAILEADAYYENEKYKEAKLSYKKAISIKPNDEEVLSRLNEIESLLSKEVKNSTDKSSNKQYQNSDTKTYQIIVGCFKNKQNAVKLRESLLARGFDSHLISRGELTAVTYSSHNTIHEAYNYLTHVVEDSLEDDAWVLKQNHN